MRAAGILNTQSQCDTSEPLYFPMIAIKDYSAAQTLLYVFGVWCRGGGVTRTTISRVPLVINFKHN